MEKDDKITQYHNQSIPGVSYNGACDNSRNTTIYKKTEEVNVENVDLSQTTNINRENIDFSRIAKNANNAIKKIFFDKSQIAEAYWGDNGQLNYKALENGAIEIYENDTLMGYTDKDGLLNLTTEIKETQQTDNKIENDPSTTTTTNNNATSATIETNLQTNQIEQNTTNNTTPPVTETNTTIEQNTPTSTPQQNSTSTSLVSFIAEMTSSHEGDENSINYNDGGAVSIGKIQWRADNAKNLLNDIKNANPTQFDNIISQYGAQNLANSLASGASWSNHTVTPGSAEANAIAALLNTTESKQIQNQKKLEFVQNYVNRAKSFGLTDEKAIAYIADMYNQYGQYSDLINNKIIPQALANGGDLDAVLNATRANTNLYLGRRESVYNSLKDASLEA